MTSEAPKLASILSMLADAPSDAELGQSYLPVVNILAIKVIAEMANALCTLGNYTAARSRTQDTLALGARCCSSAGDFKVAAQLCKRAESCCWRGSQGTDTDLRSENFAISRDPRSGDPQCALSGRDFDLLNPPTIDTSIGAESTLVGRNLDARRLQFMTTFTSPQGALLCDVVSATLPFWDGDVLAARSILERVLVKLNL
ncbi:hypothetical protein K438DRAFT_1970057 [Mycena galopus ATCC 62051]|nr:hypothetical protein K438DRAFT_1970057 [Mycena galopus ATCC 62051]